jgi:hypothetical protein
VVERHAPDPDDDIEPDDDEIDAGYEQVSERFGPLLGLDAAAKGDILSYDAVLRVDADTVLSKLRLEGAKSAYQRRYNHLTSKKKD